MMKDLQ